MLACQLDDALNDDLLIIEEARTESEALRRIRDPESSSYAVLITSLDIPRDLRSVSDSSGRGFRLVEALAAKGPGKTKCLIMSPAGTRLGSSLQVKGTYCLFLEEGPEMFEKIVSATRDALAGRKRQPRLSVGFVQDKNSRNWSYWLDGGRELPGVKDHGMFALPLPQMRELAKRSAGLGTMREGWLKELVGIGEELQLLIFQNGNAFEKIFGIAVKTAGGIEKTRFSFDVSQKMFSLAVEALVGPEPEVGGFVRPVRNSRLKKQKKTGLKNKIGKAACRGRDVPCGQEDDAERVPFWMLKAPIYRSLSVTPPALSLGQSRSLLFEEGRQPVNCLIIEADVTGQVEVPGRSKPVTLSELGNVDTECDWLETQLKDRKNQEEWGIGHVARINLGNVPADKSFRNYLSDMLAEREWHLVHYSGHSLYIPAAEGPGRGFLFLPGSGRPIEVLDAGLFANWLTQTQFLFLSSCHSSEEGFVFEMARNYVPAVLGFRWDIRDDLAADYAARFYESLFRFRSIESAFVAARNSVRKDHGVKEQVWAAPMLVLLDSRRASAAVA